MILSGENNANCKVISVFSKTALDYKTYHNILVIKSINIGNIYILNFS